MMNNVLMTPLLLLELDRAGNLSLSLNRTPDPFAMWWFRHGMENGKQYDHENLFYDMRYDLYWQNRHGFYLVPGLWTGNPYPVTFVVQSRDHVYPLDYDKQDVKLREEDTVWRYSGFGRHLAAEIASGYLAFFTCIQKGQPS